MCNAEHMGSIIVTPLLLDGAFIITEISVLNVLVLWSMGQVLRHDCISLDKIVGLKFVDMVSLPSHTGHTEDSGFDF